LQWLWEARTIAGLAEERVVREGIGETEGGRVGRRRDRVAAKEAERHRRRMGEEKGHERGVDV